MCPSVLIVELVISQSALCLLTVGNSVQVFAAEKVVHMVVEEANMQFLKNVIK